MIDALPKLAGTKARVVRAFADGDFVILHTEYFLFGQDFIGFDVFRFEQSQIVEHWDNLQPNRIDEGKVVEHWDVLEMIPLRSDWQNANG